MKKSLLLCLALLRKSFGHFRRINFTCKSILFTWNRFSERLSVIFLTKILQDHIIHLNHIIHQRTKSGLNPDFVPWYSPYYLPEPGLLKDFRSFSCHNFCWKVALEFVKQLLCFERESCLRALSSYPLRNDKTKQPLCQFLVLVDQ